MEAKKTNMDLVLSVLDSNAISYKIDNNPSVDKIERITKSIQRKAQLYRSAIEKYCTTKNVTPAN